MTISVAPAASGTNTLPVRAATPTAKVRKNAPMNSVVYFLAAIPYREVRAAYPGADSCVITPAICLRSLNRCFEKASSPLPVPSYRSGSFQHDGGVGELASHSSDGLRTG
jgi:hypothetical protein